MAYGLGGESGFTQPLAFSIGWGLAFATVLTLFILPVLLMIRVDIIDLFSRLFNKLKGHKVLKKIPLNMPPFDDNEEPPHPPTPQAPPEPSPQL